MSRIISVTEADFLVQQEKDYDISNMTYRQIHNFFSKYSQRYFYSVNVESNLSEVVAPDALKEFGLFGISFNEDMVKIRNKHFLLVLKENDLDSLDNLKSAIEREKEKAGCSVFRYAVVEKEYGSDATGILQKKCDNELLREVLPHIIVFNRGFTEITPVVKNEKRFADKYRYRNFAEFFSGKSIRSGTLSLNLRNLNAIFDDILSVKGERVIYTCDSVEKAGIDLTDPVYRMLLPAIAAYLAIEHKFKFELHGILNDIYLNASTSFTRQFYNYADEYLKLVSNPVDCGFTVRDRFAYLYVLDRNEMYENPGKFCPVIRYVGTGFNLDTLSLAGGSVINSERSLSSVEVLCIESVFGLVSPSVAEVRKAMLKLGKVFGDFAAMLRSAHYPVAEILDVTNTMLCRFDGKVHIVYITGITGCYPYNVQPVNTKFKSFKEYVRVGALSEIKDLLLLEDGAGFEKIMQKYNLVAGGNNHYKLPRTAHGIIYKHLTAIKGVVKEDVAMADELGLWYLTSAQFRGNAKTGILSLLSLDAARTCNLITCFGGPHPCIGTDFKLDYKCWR